MNPNDLSILIVDDDPIVADSLAALLQQNGYQTHRVGSAEEAIDALAETPFAIMLADVALPGMDGIQLLRSARRDHPDLMPIVITGYGTIEAAVKSIRLGAIDYLTKPMVDAELLMAVEKAARQHKLVAENRSLRQQLDQRYGLDSIVGADVRMRNIFETVEAVAPSKTTVLMAGESGTGKSLIARAIHRRSPRADMPFVEISCGSIPETLLESELFGHTKGAFTGAHTDKPGRFLAAHGGTLFLDEINSASPAMQLKLLRVIQERCFEAVGSNEPVEVDVRVVLASNQPLEDLVAKGEFRQDLYYRINVVMIELPPLRDRVSDIPLLAEHFLHLKAAEVGKQIMGFTDTAMDALRGYTFPGNIRELENIVERAVVLTRATRIDTADLPAHVAAGEAPRFAEAVSSPGMYQPMPLKKALEDPEKQIILAALQANNWNRQQTADVLDINRTTLYKKIKQYDLEQYGETG